MNKEEAMLDAIFQNAIRFFNISIDEVIKSDFSDINNIIKTSVLIQMTVELSLKYAVAYNNGNLSIKKILGIKYQNKSIDEIYEEFINNTLKVEKIEKLKNYIKKTSIFKFEKNEEIEKMEQFQKIRNRLLHFTYNFTEMEIVEFKKNFLYIVFKIIFPLLYEGYSKESLVNLTPSDFMKLYVGETKFGEIRSFDNYKEVMLNIAHSLMNKEEVTLGKCISCNEKSWIKEIGKCIICEFNSRDDILLSCPVCKENKSVIYESINMEYNNNAATGVCICCNRKMSVIKCKKCGRYSVYEDDIAFCCAIEGLDESICDIDCDNIPKKDKIPFELAYSIPAIVISECINNNDISLLNSNKNIPRILGKKVEEYYINNKKIDAAVVDGISYLIEKKYILLKISIEEILLRVNNLIETEFNSGSFKEITALYKRLFYSLHGEKVGREFDDVFHNVLNNIMNKKFTGLSEEEYKILYECRDNLDIDTKLFFGIYKNDGLIKPSEVK